MLVSSAKVLWSITLPLDGNLLSWINQGFIYIIGVNIMTENRLPITDVKEAIVAINELSLFMIGQFKDGVQAGDFLAFWSKLQADEKFKQILKDGFDGYKNIGSQLQDADVYEGMELAKIQLDYIPKILEAFKPAEVITDGFSAPTA